ncbi:transposase [Methylomarinovum tepidoasis]|uniref:Transposase n=1 Tax=Methylomarinovum tepidoasis TaxID=2840183 RepID=A0AAU9BY75_9GAMM|nr:transposase [Methylomarinovum sp. IN45]BCX88685.1 transposase [Methylomarinovum sp. IN45]
MLLAHRIELKPNHRQATFFAKGCGVARFAYNWALERWQQRYKDGKKVDEALLRKELNAIKREQFPWMLEVPKSAVQQAVKDLGSAFDHFFRRVKNGEKPGFPRFKKRGVNDSFRIDNGPARPGADAVKVKGSAIRIPKLGWVRMREPVRFRGQSKQAIISRQADRWYVSILVDTPHHPNQPRKNHGGAVGVDLGVKALATLSTGEVVEGPKALNRLLRKLRRLNKQLSRKQTGSHNRRKAQMALARLHRRIGNIRKDALHKLTTQLVLNHDIIVIEDLNVSGMMQNRHLSRHIADASFYELRRQLEYKAKLYGCEIVLADRFYPSSKTCSNCGAVKAELKLSERIFRCDTCQFEIDRDLNAAINLEKLAVSFTDRVNACGGMSAGSDAEAPPSEAHPVKQEADIEQVRITPNRFE